MSKIVSILIPAYNAERWISETIDSALNQTWSQKELIIVDDGSTDNTLAIARKFESKCVKVVAQENKGAASARNTALSCSQGDYIQWLDADDLFPPYKISEQLKSADDGRSSRILSSSAFGTFYFRTKKAKFATNSLWQNLDPVEWLTIKFIKLLWMHPAGWLVPRRLVDLSGFWDERLSLDDDGEYFSRIVSVSERIEFVPSAKCFYRQGNFHSLSGKRSDKALESLFLATKLCVKYLRLLDDGEETRIACLRFLKNRMTYYELYNRKIREDFYGLAQELGGDIRPSEEEQSFLDSIRYRMAKTAKDEMWKLKTLTCKSWDRVLQRVNI